jgi:hypothetical protein
LCLFVFVMLTASRSASALSSECTDLDAIPRQPAVDYESRIQPIFTSCTGCHGENGSAGLDLRPGQAYANLVGVESTTSPPQARVEPFQPEDSLLLSALNCAITGGPSFQMPGTDPAQRPAARSVPAMHPAGLGILAALMLLVLFATRRQRVRSWP